MKIVAIYFLYLFAECVVNPIIHLSDWLYDRSNTLYYRILRKLEPPHF